jgi:hypothetical protein
MPSEETGDKSISDFIVEQKETNKSVLTTLNKLVEAMSDLKVFQSELNIVKAEVDRVRQKQDSINDKVIANAEVLVDVKSVKNALIGFVVLLVFGGGYAIKDQSEKSNNELKEIIAAMESQTKAINDIADNITNKDIENND